MKNRIVLFFFGFFLAFSIKGQRITVSEELPFKSEDVYELLGEMEDHYLIYRNEGYEHEIISFDEELKLRWRKPVEMFSKRSEVLAVQKAGDNINFILLERIKATSRLQLVQYDPAANLRDSVTVFTYEKSYYAPVPEITFSEDKKRFVAYYLDRDQHIHVFEYNLERFEVEWQLKLSMPNLSKEAFEAALLDSRGNFFLIFDKGNGKEEPGNFHYLEILEIRGENPEPELIKIPMEGYLTYDLHFVLDELNEQLVAGGFYSEENRGRANGYFYLSYKFAKEQTYFLRFHPFSENFLSGLLGRQSRRSNTIENVEVGELILRRDGGILLVGELNHKVDRYAANPSRPFTYSTALSTSYFFDDLFVISIHPNGDFHWESIFYKKQYSQDDDAVYSSFFLMKTPGNLRFLYNDEIKSENTVSEYVLQGDGKFWRNSVLNTKGQKIKLRFRDAIQLSGKELIVPSDVRGKLKLVRIAY